MCGVVLVDVYQLIVINKKHAFVFVFDGAFRGV